MVTPRVKLSVSIGNSIFNPSVKVTLDDQRISSNGAVLLFLDIDHKLDIAKAIASGMSDPRVPDCIRYTVVE